MTDYDRDRGAYTPSGEAPLAFDPRSQGGRAGRPGGPPTTLIISALILLVLLGGIFIYYRSGVRHSGEPPVVGQTLGDIKQAPPASSQPTDEAAGAGLWAVGADGAAGPFSDGAGVRATGAARGRGSSGGGANLGAEEAAGACSAL